jgi:hypothetical protein
MKDGLNSSEFELITPEGKGILATFDNAGVVTFAIGAGQGCSVRGTEMFNRMMQHFGAEVRAIQGVWLKDLAGKESTNIDKVNELTGAGVPLEEAITHAWTVTRARKWGFNKVRLLRPPEGIAGSYTEINVLIEK